MSEQTPRSRGSIKAVVSTTPRPIMPDVDEREESIQAGGLHSSQIQKQIDRDPEVIEAERLMKQAEAALEAAKGKAFRSFLTDVTGKDYDPEKVEELCAAQPWKKGRLTEISENLFGTVPETFIAMAANEPEGSNRRGLYEEAAEKARFIYRDQMMRDIKRACAPYDRPGMRRSDRRAGYQSISVLLDSANRRMKKNPVTSLWAARLLWCALMVGERFMDNHNRDGGGYGPGYRQWNNKTAKDLGERPPEI